MIEAAEFSHYLIRTSEGNYYERSMKEADRIESKAKEKGTFISTETIYKTFKYSNPIEAFK